MPVSRRRTAAFALVFGAAASVIGLATINSGAATATPQAPSSFHGFVTVDGEVAPQDAEVRALVGGIDCTQSPAGSPNVVLVDRAAAYVVDVVHEDQRAGCGREGVTIDFTVNGYRVASPGTWRIGLQRLDLQASSAGPRILAEPASSDETLAVLQSSSGGGSGVPLLAMTLGALAAVSVVAAGIGVRLRRRPALQSASSDPEAPR